MDTTPLPDTLSSAIADTELLGRRRGVEVRLLRDERSPLMRHLGQLREQAFRAVGEGTGKALDLDHFDHLYEHLFLWHPDSQRLIGAYRLADCHHILRSHGPDGLYSTSLFEPNDAVLTRLDSAVELGRSFIHPDFWGQGWLALLWGGIGRWLTRHPHIHYLYGPVSISARYPPEARALLVHFYRHHFAPKPNLAANPRHPYEPPSLPAPWRDAVTQPYPQAFRQLKRLLGQLGERVPTLYRHYTEMGGPDACQFLAFGEDRDFGHCIDGLMLADMRRFDANRLMRYQRDTLS